MPNNIPVYCVYCIMFPKGRVMVVVSVDRWSLYKDALVLLSWHMCNAYNGLCRQLGPDFPVSTKLQRQVFGEQIGIWTNQC